MLGRRSVREAPLRLSKAALLSFAPDYEQRKILPSLTEVQRVADPACEGECNPFATPSGSERWGA
jgi:hypothetical protein